MSATSRKAQSVIRRRAWLVVALAALGAIAAWLVAQSDQTTFTARAVMVVPPFDPATDPAGDPGSGDNSFLGNPFGANLLAAAYASLMTEDAQILESVASRTGLSTDQVADEITVTNSQNTPLIQVTVKDRDQDFAVELLSAFLAAVTGENPASDSISAKSLRTVRIDPPEAANGSAEPLAASAGLLFGGLLGGVVVAFWERSNPRVDTATDVTELFGIPARRVDQLSGVVGAWVMQRWSELAGVSQTVVVIVPEPTPLNEAVAFVPRVAEELDAVLYQGEGPLGARAMEIEVPASRAPGESRPPTIVPVPRDRFRLVVSRPLPERELLRGSAPSFGLVVIAIRSGTRVDDLVPVTDLLTSIGMSPGWAIIHG